MFSTDIDVMQRAIRIARTGHGLVEPNPMVGAVIVDGERNLIAEGYHQKFGEAHAEINAIRLAGKATRGADLFVTLEPCSHFGKTPPCADAVIAAGVALGWIAPDTAKALKPLGDGFIKLIKMVIAPVVFCTVVHGIASVRDAGRVGRVGLKALVYFEVVSTFALALGLVVGNVFKTGQGFNLDPAQLDTSAVSSFIARAKDDSVE
jgi:pyrimidine deaminase RibD-like protein